MPDASWAPAELHTIFAAAGSVLAFPLVEAGRTRITLGGVLLLAALCALVCLAQVALRRWVIERALRRTRMGPALQNTIAQIAGYVVMTWGLYLAFQAAGIDLSSLAFIVGAIGLGLGFGLQNVINNFVSGVIILAERPIALGDRIEVGAVAGQVRRIGLRSTTVVTNDNIAVIVPNAQLLSERVTNWSHGDPRVRFRLPVSVAYGTDLDLARRVLLEVAAANPQALREPAPAVFCTGFGDSAIELELAVWTLEMARSPRRFRSELYFALDRALREHGIEVPFPQREVRLRRAVDSLPLAGAPAAPLAHSPQQPGRDRSEGPQNLPRAA